MAVNPHYSSSQKNGLVHVLWRLRCRSVRLVIAFYLTAFVIGVHLACSEVFGITNPQGIAEVGLGFGPPILGVLLPVFYAILLHSRRIVGMHRQSNREHAPHEQTLDVRYNNENTARATRGKTIRWAYLYDWLVKLISLGKERSLRRVTLALAFVKPGEKVLDVGCGTGSLTIFAKEQAGPRGNVYGIDPMPEMIEIARRKADKARVAVTFQVGHAEEIEFPNNEFDVVLSSLMMHHLPDDLKFMGLAEIYRVLKPSGRLLIVDIESSDQPAHNGFFDLAIHLHGGRTAMQKNVKNLVPLMKQAGFRSVKAEKINQQLAYVIGLKNSSR